MRGTRCKGGLEVDLGMVGLVCRLTNFPKARTNAPVHGEVSHSCVSDDGPSKIGVPLVWGGRWFGVRSRSSEALLAATPGR